MPVSDITIELAGSELLMYPPAGVNRHLERRRRRRHWRKLIVIPHAYITIFSDEIHSYSIHFCPSKPPAFHQVILFSDVVRDLA